MNTKVIVFSALAATLILTGCGRAGAPLSPYQASVVQAKENKTPPPEKPTKDSPFVLDGLLN